MKVSLIAKREGDELAFCSILETASKAQALETVANALMDDDLCISVNITRANKQRGGRECA